MERQSLNTSQWLYWLERGALLLAYYDESTDKFTFKVFVKAKTITNKNTINSIMKSLNKFFPNL